MKSLKERFPVGAPALARSLCSCFLFFQLGNQGKFFICSRKQKGHIPQSTLNLSSPGSGCGAGIFWFIWSFSALLWGFHVGNCALSAVLFSCVGLLDGQVLPVLTPSSLFLKYSVGMCLSWVAIQDVF